MTNAKCTALDYRALVDAEYNLLVLVSKPKKFHIQSFGIPCI